jgi:NTE family protein
LLSNTPLREVIDASPVKDKRIYLVENYPKNIDKLPDNLQEVQHRTRDIMFSDKTLHNIQMSKTITYYLRLIDDLYKMLEDHFGSEKKKIKRNLKRSGQDIKKYQKNMELKLRVYII